MNYLTDIQVREVCALVNSGHSLKQSIEIIEAIEQIEVQQVLANKEYAR